MFRFFIKYFILLELFLTIFWNYKLHSQTNDDFQNLGKIKFPQSSSIKSDYVYDSKNNVYIYSKTIDNYPINTPLVLKPDEFEYLIIKENIKKNFKEKIKLLYQNNGDIKEIQKNLLPELYVNSDFFQSIFGSNVIDIKPQGSIGIDIGAKFQKTDNPSFSPRNRKNFAFDFDQRINLGLIGDIGERFKITANYDTESTFDFQNLIRLEFNPPRLKKLDNYIPGEISTKIQNSREIYDNINRNKNDFINYKDQLTDYLELPISEDAIIQNIDIGNINMPINSSLISGAQSLMGVKTQLKFGKTNITAVFAEQRSQSQSLVAQGDGTLQNFSVYALDYEDNRHFFLAHYFRDNYDNFLKNYPYVSSPINITRVEVWVTNRQLETSNVRNLVAIQDLGERDINNTRLGSVDQSFFKNEFNNNIPSNDANFLNPESIDNGSILNESIRDVSKISEGFGRLEENVIEGIDYATLESARKLEPNEYYLNKQLGYISLNQKLSNDEILGISFQYTYKGKVYQVGEFANGGVMSTEITFENEIKNQESKSLVIKLLKSSLTDVNQPVWDLMMKNIYNIGAFDLSNENFKLNILYTNPTPLNYLKPINESIWPSNLKNKTLLNKFNLDRLDSVEDFQVNGDGFFDYVPGVTVNERYGRIIFPSVEPFGEYLFKLLTNSKNNSENYEIPESYNENQKNYVFREMYTSTKAAALEFNEKNKFELKGSYKSKGGNGISLGAFNIPKGSVKVMAGGRLLSEGIDYTVNYQIGRLRILDPSINASNIPLKITVENNSVFGQQNKRFSGFDLIHRFNENFMIGGNVINLSENPLTQKANYGSEPVNNTMIGFNANASREVPILTRLINKLPMIDSEVPSLFSFSGEVATLISKNPKNTELNGLSTIYIDDFEGAQTSIDIKSPFSWYLSSVPTSGFLGAEAKKNDITGGFNRALISWYTIDPIFYSNQLRPTGINNQDISLNTTRRIFINEIFPEQDLIQGQSTVQSTLDLAYFPDEKGPYNNNLVNDFKQNPKNNWAGITRPINSTNFEQTNVEFIEFWLLDTFSDDNSTKNDLGFLYFHLGNISEDILKDGRKQYENGLPVSESIENIKFSNWGKTPSTQSLLYAFNTIESDRLKQDVGLDGLNDNEEREIYFNGPENDPAGDNYQYFAKVNGGIVDRYKRYNGTDGNSPVAFSNLDRGRTSEPDTEDINKDQTMNTIDSYFSYKVPIRKNMTVGNHPFVSDVRENVKVDLPNGKKINTRWIQFKVPIDKSFYEGTNFESYYDNINNIQDLRSIRFIRMLLNDFEKPIVLRFGTLELVRGDWRRYNKKLNNNILQNNSTTIDVSTVNILENENRIPINYVLPPDIVREKINTNNTVIRQNEQSLSMKFCDLKPMDSRGIYKNIEIDLRQYKKLKMYIHAESIKGNKKLPGDGINDDFDKRVVAFIRLGSDLNQNYYQIEVPLKPTSYGTDSSNKFSSEEVWIPESNSIDIDISKLREIKSKIIGLSIDQASYFDEDINSVDEFFPISKLPGDKKYKFSIKGNPSLGSVKNLMIGIKNPSKNNGDDLCGEVWFNELRIAGIDSKGGWAAIGSLNGNLADLANFSLTGKFSTIGFGSIDQTPNQRNREDNKQYDFVTNVDLGKFLPEKWSVTIPFNYNIGKTIIKPEYDPLYDDVLLSDRLDSAVNKSQRDSINNQSNNYTQRKSINFIGVRKIKNGSKSKFYDIENFNFSYSYNELNHSDFEMEKQIRKNVFLNSNYSHSFSPFEFSPFFNNELLNKSNKLKFIKELNFNFLPSNITFSHKIDRLLNKQKFREAYFEGIDTKDFIELPELQQRNYYSDFNYSITHNITRSMRLNFTSTTKSIVKNYFRLNEENLKSINFSQDIWGGFFDSGDPNSHFQSININYNLPFQYFPILSFIDSNYSYSGNFSWDSGSNILDNVTSSDGRVLGSINTIQNSNSKVLNGSLSFERLFKNLGFKFESKNKSIINSIIKSISNIKRVQFSYSENNGSVLPGYTQNIGHLGTIKPTLAYTFGDQADIRYEIAKKGWLTDFPDFNQVYSQIRNNQLKINSQINFKVGLIIDINLNKDYSYNYSENFLIQDGNYNKLNFVKYGNFGISTILIKTAFKKNSIFSNSIFEKFKRNRVILSKKLAYINGVDINNLDVEGYYNGYGRGHQSVTIPAFLAAYSGQSPLKTALNPTQKSPLPNWNLKYTGLMKNKIFKKIFNRFSISHGYRSSFTINNFQNNLDYDSTNPYLRDDAGNFLVQTLYGNLNLVEQFNPLFKLDFELKNSFKFLAEFVKDRALSLSLDNNILTESFGEEFIFGLGYRIKDLSFRTNVGGRRTSLKGDLNFKADVSYRNNLTVLRNLDIENNQVTAGQSIWSIKVSADYDLSRNLTALFFYDHNFSKFAVSSAFPQTSIRSGITIRYNFGN